MAYQGYQLKIGNLKLPIPDGENKSIFKPGTYSFNKSKRLIAEWQDSTGKIHHEVFPNDKVKISFTISERTKEQHALLRPLLESRNNIYVEYWDDINGTYNNGYFFIDEISNVSSIATLDTIYYDELNVVLTEY